MRTDDEVLRFRDARGVPRNAKDAKGDKQSSGNQQTQENDAQDNSGPVALSRRSVGSKLPASWPLWSSLRGVTRPGIGRLHTWDKGRGRYRLPDVLLLYWRSRCTLWIHPFFRRLNRHTALFGRRSFLICNRCFLLAHIFTPWASFPPCHHGRLALLFDCLPSQVRPSCD